MSDTQRRLLLLAVRGFSDVEIAALCRLKATDWAATGLDRGPQPPASEFPARLVCLLVTGLLFGVVLGLRA